MATARRYSYAAGAESSSRRVCLRDSSVFAIDVESEPERFVTLVPPLDPEYERIRIPRWHTFLEGLVHASLFPQSGLTNVRLKGYLGVLKEYLVLYRLQPDMDVEVPSAAPYNDEEQRMLDEVVDPPTRLWLRGKLRGKFPHPSELQALATRRAATPASYSLVMGIRNRRFHSVPTPTHSAPGFRMLPPNPRRQVFLSRLARICYRAL